MKTWEHLPDTMYVLDGITYFSPQFFLIELHLEEQKHLRSDEVKFWNKIENITSPYITGRQASSTNILLISNHTKSISILKMY